MNQRLLLALTLVNVALLAFSLTRLSATGAEADTQIIRGRGLELVDNQGRVRASIAVLPADAGVKMPDGTKGYPETVLLRLITSQGRPNVKLAATETGAGLVLGGEADPTYVQVLAARGNTSLKFSDNDGREQVIKP
ncbi:hypothetical protein BH10PSE9_BH10PSE9_04720 [soil metagenome]